MLSQWRLFSRGVIWQSSGALKTSLAALNEGPSRHLLWTISPKNYNRRYFRYSSLPVVHQTKTKLVKHPLLQLYRSTALLLFYPFLLSDASTLRSVRTIEKEAGDKQGLVEKNSLIPLVARLRFPAIVPTDREPEPGYKVGERDTQEDFTISQTLLAVFQTQKSC